MFIAFGKKIETTYDLLFWWIECMEDCLNDIEERKYTSAKFSASSWTIVITSFDFVIDNVWGDVVIYVEITKLLGKKIPSSRYNDYMLTTTPEG